MRGQKKETDRNSWNVDEQVSQASQENKEEATQAVETLKTMIQHLEESLGDHPTTKWDEMMNLLKKLQEKNEELWRNCAEADKRMEELESTVHESKTQNKKLKIKVKALQQKIQEIQPGTCTPTASNLEGSKMPTFFQLCISFYSSSYVRTIRLQSSSHYCFE